MLPRHILILEDDADRNRRFAQVVQSLGKGFNLIVWRDARVMIREVERYLADTSIISLDCDLFPEDESAVDPGDGIEVAEFLAGQPPACPVIVHSSNYQGSLSMIDRLTEAGWTVRRVAPIGDDWIEHDWRMTVCELL